MVDVKLYTEIFATFLTILGIILISIPKRIGLHILIISSVIWGIYGYFTNQWFFLLQNIIVIFFNILGIYRWKKQGIK